ncbi:MAG: hypothetical protein AAFU79_25080 [Myxococcota bacterium]
MLRELSVHELQLAPSRALQGEGADAVDVPKTPLCGLVDKAVGVGGENGFVGASLAEAVLDVLGRVLRLRFSEAEADMNGGTRGTDSS